VTGVKGLVKPLDVPGNPSKPWVDYNYNSRPIGRVGLMTLLGRCDKNRYPGFTPVA
jgi:hypothetical protein